MLNVDYKHRIGYFTETQNHDGEVVTFEIGIYKANCLCAAVYMEPKENGQIKPQLVWFFVDTKHMRKCIKADILKGYDNFYFDAKELTPDTWKLVQALGNNGKHITIN